MISHSGSNGYFKSVILVRLEGRRAVLLSTNIAAVSERSLIDVAREIDAL